MKHPAILLLLCLSLSSSHGEALAKRALGGAEAYRLVEQATHVTVRRLHITLTPLPVKSDGGRTFAVTEKAGEVVLLPARTATALKAILISDDTYNAASKLCDFTPAVRFSFEVHGLTLDVDVCFGCGDLQTALNGKILICSPFDPAYERLLKLSKKLFPDDGEIQKLDGNKFKRKPIHHISLSKPLG